MNGPISRRRLLALSGGGVGAVLAGCTGGDDTAGNDRSNGERAAADNGGSATDDDGTSTDDNGSTMDDDELGADDDGTSTDDDSPTDPADSQLDGEPGELEETDIETLEAVFRWPTSYVAVTDYRGNFSANGTSTMTVSEGDLHFEIDYQTGMSVAMYSVGGQNFTVVNQQCSVEDESGASGLVPDEELLESTTPVTGETTIDGEPVYVSALDDEIAWYVHQVTGYPVRFESPNLVTVYHSWDDTGPISPPDMECIANS